MVETNPIGGPNNPISNIPAMAGIGEVSKSVKKPVLNPVVSLLSHSTYIKNIKLEQKTIYILADNGQSYSNPENLGEVESKIAQSEPIALVYDHHHVELPPALKGMVGAELVLHNVANIIDYVNLCVANGYKVVIGSHVTSYDPDAAISQFLIKEILAGRITKDYIPPIYIELANYANITNYYKFPYSSNPEYTLRGVLDGLAEKYKDTPELLTKKTDEILRWVTANGLDPNDFNKFTGRMAEKDLPAVFNEGIENRQKATIEIIANLHNKDKINTFIVNVRNKKGENVPLQVFFCNDPSLNGKAIDDLCYSQATPVAVIKRIRTPQGDQWWVGMRAEKYLDGNGVKRSDDIDNFKEQITDVIQARFGGKDYFKGLYSSVAMFKDSEFSRPLKPATVEYYLNNPELAKFGRERDAREATEAMQAQLMALFGRTKTGGLGKAALKYNTEQLLNNTSFEDIMINISLKKINDAPVTDLDGDIKNGHERGDLALKLIEEKINKWAKINNLDIQVFRDGANYIVRCRGAKPAHFYTKELEENVGSVEIGKNTWKTKPKVGWTSYDPKAGEYGSADEYLSFLGKVVSQVDAGSIPNTGKFEPEPVSVRTPKAIAFRPDLMAEVLKQVNELYPKATVEEAQKYAHDAYLLKYIEPDSGLLNGNALEYDYDKMVAKGKKGTLAFLDADKISAFKKTFGPIVGNEMIDRVLDERFFPESRAIFAKYGINFYRQGSGSEEFFLLGEGTDKETMYKALDECSVLLNQKAEELIEASRTQGKPIYMEIPSEWVKTMPKAGQEIMNNFIREHPGSINNEGMLKFDVTIMPRGENAKYIGTSWTGKVAIIESAETLSKVTKEAEELKTELKQTTRGVKSTIIYLEQGAPGGKLNYRTAGTVYSSAKDGLIGFMVEAPFSALYQLCVEGKVDPKQLAHDMEESGIGWAEFGAIRGATQNLLGAGPNTAANAAIVITTLWQLHGTSPEQRGMALARGTAGLGGFIGGSQLVNFVPGPQWIRTLMRIPAGVFANKVTNEMFAFAYRNFPAFRDAVNSRAANLLGDAGAYGAIPVTLYYGGEAVTSALGYSIREAGLKKTAEKWFRGIGRAGRAGPWTAALSLEGLPLNASAANAGNIETGMWDIAQGQGSTKGGAEVAHFPLDISSATFEQIISDPDKTHAPRLAQELATVLNELGYFPRDFVVPDGFWEDFNEALQNGNLDQFLGDSLHGNERRTSFIHLVRSGLTHFQNDLIKRGINVNVGQFDAQTCHYMIMAHGLKNAAVPQNAQ